ncbi:MAG: hypothetical protein WCV92_05315 [Candidatus Buchananbacteria bacterium]
MEIKRVPHIEKATIPDSDMSGWINELRNSELTEEQIDMMLSRLNKKYMEIKLLEPAVKEATLEIIDHFKKLGKELSDENLIAWENMIRSKLIRMLKGGEY